MKNFLGKIGLAGLCLRNELFAVAFLTFIRPGGSDSREEKPKTKMRQIRNFDIKTDTWKVKGLKDISVIEVLKGHCKNSIFKKISKFTKNSKSTVAWSQKGRDFVKSWTL